MKKYKLALRLSGLFCFWIALSNFTLLWSGYSRTRLPNFLTNVLSLGYFIFFPLNPLFEVLGLLEGEMIRGPTPLGVVIGCFIYAGILFGIVAIFEKKNPPKK
jgi:hypothetical protein